VLRLLPTLVVAAACTADAPLPATGTPTTEVLSSPTLGDDLLLRIRTPPDVDPDGAYPVVFVLDPTFAGGQKYDRTVGMVSAHEADASWPDTIVVGLDYDDPNKRFRDYTPTLPLADDFSNADGADRFYAALRDDVLPHVDETLPVDPTFRVLQGHSNGGSFVWYATLRHRDDTPPLFAGAIAADSGIPEWIFTMERWHAEQSGDLPVRLYVARAVDNGRFQEATYDEVVARLTGRGYPGLAHQYDAFDTDHGGVVTPAFEAGLQFTLGEGR
jgi:predicted alpha/beta superfamily hydrolase